MRFLLIAAVVLVCLSLTDGAAYKRFDPADLNIQGVEVLRKEGLPDDHIVIDIPKPEVHYYASEPVALAEPAEAEQEPY